MLQILLKGAHYDELKKVKFVVQHAVSLAYYLILETSFLMDQRAIFLNTRTVGIVNDILSCDVTSNTDVFSPEGSSSFFGISSEYSKTIVNDEFQIPLKGDWETFFDPQCILVLLTSRCILRGTACKQNQLSRIKFYENSDMSLGQYLHDILLNQVCLHHWFKLLSIFTWNLHLLHATFLEKLLCLNGRNTNAPHVANLRKLMITLTFTRKGSFL